MTPTDQELLSEYANNASESAFTTVVERQVNLVYSAALRLTGGDAALAEDITQQVFCDLAQKAAMVSHAASVAGWLHTHTRFISLTAIRGERRRRIREQEAFAMHDQNSTPEFNWSQLRPLLDEAVGELRPADRDAVILRFFENKSHREVGETLGLNENAARMKIERALEKLQAHFVRRGVTISSAVIATAMSANSVQAAPVGLGSKVANASFVKSVGAVGFVQAVWAAYFMSTTSKVITTTVIVALIASIAVSFHHVAITRQSNEPAQNANVAALPTAQRSPVLVLSPPSKVQVAAPKLPPAPAANVPDAYGLTLEKKDITDNLRELATAASQYMLDEGVTQARYSDIVGTSGDYYYYISKDPKFSENHFTPAANESYDDFILDQTQTQVTERAPDGSIVTYNL